MKRRCSQPSLLLCLLTAFLCFLLTAMACGDDEEVRVTVVAILATDQNKDVDPKLTEIAKAIQKKNPKLTGFQIGKKSCEAVDVNKPTTFDLGEGQSVVVTVRQKADEDNRIKLTVKVPWCGQIKYTTCCGKYLPITTCYKTEKGECLMLAVMVKPCNGK